MVVEEAVFQTLLVLRTLVLLILLANAALQDVKHRVLNASAWIPVVVTGVLSLVLEMFVNPNAVLLPKTTIVVSMFSAFLLLGLYGLGDALILIGVSLTHISVEKAVLCGCLVNLLFPEFGLTVLLNAEILSLTIIVLNLVNNLRAGVWNMTATMHMSLPRRLANMLLLKAVKAQSREEYEESIVSEELEDVVMVKYAVPMVPLILLGYITTLFFGSLVPISASC